MIVAHVILYTEMNLGRFIVHICILALAMAEVAANINIFCRIFRFSVWILTRTLPHIDKNVCLFCSNIDVELEQRRQKSTNNCWRAKYNMFDFQFVFIKSSIGHHAKKSDPNPMSSQWSTLLWRWIWQLVAGIISQFSFMQFACKPIDW